MPKLYRIPTGNWFNHLGNSLFRKPAHQKLRMKKPDPFNQTNESPSVFPFFEWTQTRLKRWTRNVFVIHVKSDGFLSPDDSLTLIVQKIYFIDSKLNLIRSQIFQAYSKFQVWTKWKIGKEWVQKKRKFHYWDPCINQIIKVIKSKNKSITNRKNM